MNTKYALPMVLAGSVMLSGCWLDDDDDPATTSVRVLHASSDAPAVNVRVNGDVVVPGADYKQAAVLTPGAGLADIAVDGLLPGGETATVISADGVSLRADTNYDVIAVGKVGDETIEPLILTDDGARDDANSARLRVAHLSPEAQTAAGGPVDVYVTASGDALPDEATFSFSFKESVGPLELPASDDYRIRVTAAGSDMVVFDSGQIGLPEGADLLVGAVDNTGANGDASSISLIVVNGGDVAEIFDVDQQSGVRVVHNSFVAGAVDVLLNDVVAVDDLAYPQAAPGSMLDNYAQVPVGTQNVKVTPFNDNATVAIEADLDFSAGVGYTVIANGLFADIEALVLTDTVRDIATQASVRVVHGSTLAGPVNVYLLPEGQTEVGNASPALSGVEFGQESGYLAVTPGAYNLVVTDPDGNVAIGPAEVNLEASGIYTAIARDNDAFDGADLILLDDFVMPPT